MTRRGLVIRAVAALAVIASPAAMAQPSTVAAPTFKAGDSWVTDRTIQKGPTGFARRRLSETIDRVDSDGMLVGLKPEGAPQATEEHIVGLDWSLRLVVDGVQTTAARPFAFPMKVGDTWTADWIDPRTLGLQVWARNHKVYKVVGWEDVTVPAGTFHALKIECRGTSDVRVIVPAAAQSAAVGAPGSATAVSHAQRGGKLAAQITLISFEYYAPEVKHVVKSVEEQYNASDVMVERQTTELISFKQGA